MQPDVQGSTYRHDAFISYSRKEKEFAKKLEKALEDYKPPKDLNAPQRNLNIFRDESDFTGTEYRQSVAKHLKNSAKLIVLCSPDARASSYVDEEIRLFAQTNGVNNIITILVSGIPNNEAKPGHESEMAFPEALCEVFDMPLATPYANFDLKRDKINKGNFYGSWYMLLANIYNISRDEIEQRDKQREAQTRRIKRATVSGVMAVLVVALAVTLYFWRDALSRGVLATAQSQASVNSECSLNLALKAYELAAELPNLDLAPFETEVRTSLAQSQVLATHPASQPQISDVSWDHEGKRVVFADLEGRVWLWSAEAGIEPTLLQGPTRARSVAWRPDGTSIGIATRDGVLQLWDTTEPRLMKEVRLGKGAAYRLQWDRTGRRALVWTEATGTLLVDIEKNEPQPFRGGTVAPRGHTWSPDGRWIATGNDAGEVRLISPEERSNREPFRHDPSSIHSVAWSPDGTLIAVGLDNGQIWIWNIRTLQREQVLDKHTNQVTGLEFSRDGKSLASASMDNTLRIWLWREETWRSERPLTGHTAGLNTIRWAPDGNRLATAGQDGTIRIWSAWTARSPLTVIREPGWMWSVAWSPDGTFLASTADHGRVILRVSETGTLQRLTGNSGQVTASSWSRRPVRLATADKDGKVIVRDGGNAAPIRKFEMPGMDFMAVSISPDGEFVVAAAFQEEKVLIWEVGSGKGYMNDAKATALAFSPDGSRLALAMARTQTISLLDIKARHIEKKLLQGLIPHKSTWGLAWSPKGQYLAAASNDGTVHIWDVTSGKQFPALKGHQNNVTGVAWSPTGERLATASLDGTVRLWQFPPSGSSPTVLKGHSSGVRGTAWSPDGQWLATAGLDGTTRLFHTAPDDVLKLARMQRDIGLTVPERDVCLRLAP